MKILSESELRAMCLKSDAKVFDVPDGTILTPTAQEYLKERGITPVYSDTSVSDGKPMTKVKIPVHNNKAQYVDYMTGQIYTEKPENMTHLYANVLVSKNHPRIFFRGKIDTLIAEIMKSQVIAEKSNNDIVVKQLEELKDFVQEILGAEVGERKLPEFKLIGYSSSELRFVTHHMKESFGFDHAVPTYESGELCVQLNCLRTLVREAELYAVDAFTLDNTCSRQDIVEALNRLSSAVYIIYCLNLHHGEGK
ncbi:hypothetical protein SDC9_145289 [bioreactor metagenome]|uniref:Cobalamin adenosyltransferase-like domain-containing protein n=1 Tax=bioreactor metagenome TaxID=1076179 RepID=A0A645EAE9_9ZZZZ